MTTINGSPTGSSPVLVERVRRDLDAALISKVAELEADGGRPLTREDQQALAAHLGWKVLAAVSQERALAGLPPLELDEEESLLRSAIDGLFGADALQPLLDDPSIREVRVNGPNVVWVVRTDGTKERHAPLAADASELIGLVQSLARLAATGAGGERRFDASHPVLDLQLPGGHRLWATMEVTREPHLVVRRHDFVDLTRLAELGVRGMFPPVVEDLLTSAVRARLNLILGGGTGLGKTTLLRALCNEIPAGERIVVIEDSPELALDLMPSLHPDQVTMCKREHNVEGVGGVSLADLVRSALRGSPDRVIVGETRGHEVLPMLLAMTQGNEGSMSTVHARTSGDVFSRLATYAAMCPEALNFEASAALIAGALDLVVFLSPRPTTVPGGAPGMVTSVREVTGYEGSLVTSNEVLSVSVDGRVTTSAGFRPGTADRLAAAGFDPARLEGPRPW